MNCNTPIMAGKLDRWKLSYRVESAPERFEDVEIVISTTLSFNQMIAKFKNQLTGFNPRLIEFMDTEHLLK